MKFRSSRVGVVLPTLLLLTAPALRADETEKKSLTLEEIGEDSLSTPEPEQLRWVPDGRLSFLLEVEDDDASQDGPGDGEDGEDRQDLWILDPATGDKEILVSAEAMRTVAPSSGQAGVDERERTRRSRFDVAAYRWSPDGRRILFASSGELWLYSVESRKAVRRAPSKADVRDPKFSPDGRWISFVWEHDIWVVPAAGAEEEDGEEGDGEEGDGEEADGEEADGEEGDGKEGDGGEQDGSAERQLTTGGHDLLLHGDLDWVYPEEFRVRTGYHWSPDSRHIAFLEMDESPVPTYPISEQIAWQASVDLQRYPKPGDPNPKVRVGIVAVAGGRTAWLDRAAEYVPRIDWAGDDHLAVQLLNRGQDELELVLADPATGRSRSIFFERDEHWINVTDDLTFLDGGERFLWTSERSGLRHVYLYGRDGRLVRQLTGGEFQVRGIEGVDEDGGWVYFSANRDNLLGSDLYRVRLDGSARERLTREKGTHRIDLSPETDAWVDAFSSLSLAEPARRTVYHRASGRTTEIHREPDLAGYQLVQPEIVELAAADGALVRVMLLKPPGAGAGEKYPLVVYAYGMAGFPTIRDAWSASRRALFHQFLVQRGYAVAYVDDRSSSIPGHKYAIAADHDLGPVAAADHRVAVDYLRTLPWIDGGRMALWGWSGGGFTTAYHMGHTGLFQVGIAGAPVTDWRLYDSIYTERYMGLPEDDPEAYERTSAVAGAAGLEGRLLLIHGTHDDNVHPQNTLKMMHALIKARKQFDVMMYPNKTHGISGKDHNVHLYTMIFEYLERHLRAAR